MADQLLSKDEVRDIMMAHGFTVKEGQIDLKGYVFDAAKALQRALLARLSEQQPVATTYTMEALVPGGQVKCHASFLRSVPAGTKLYAAPVPTPAAPADYVLQLLVAAGHVSQAKVDEARAIAASVGAAQAAQAVPAWQPISTAPKDGTRVLCAWGGDVHEGWCTGVGTARDGGDVWRPHSLVPVIGRPTHWQPLPAAPTPTGAGDDQGGSHA